jgi:hypothetical protein
MSTAAAAHHYATTNRYTGETVREFDALSQIDAPSRRPTTRSAAGGSGRSASVPRSCAAPVSRWPSAQTGSRAS